MAPVRSVVVLAVLLFTAGCTGGLPGAGNSTSPDDGANEIEQANYHHGLLQVYVHDGSPEVVVPASNETIQSTEPIRTLLERYRQNGTRQRMGVDGDRFNETSTAIESLPSDPELGPINQVYVQLDDSTTVVVGLAVNQTSAGG